MEDRIEVHPETLRRWMLARGLWKRGRKRKAHRKRRERRAHFGELVQMDGSFHDWYQDRAGKACLMNMVDDATSPVEARSGRAGNDLGGGARVAAMDRKVRRADGALHGLEERICARTHRKRTTAWQDARDAFWAHVPEAGHPDHRSELAAGKGASGARQWHAPGSADQEDGT